MNKIKILIPVYNDWQSVFKLLKVINLEVSKLDGEFSVIIFNDTSTENRPEFSADLNNLKSVQIINIKENRGHARCNAAGLKYINEKEDFDYVIPMDGDGEDRPEELSLLIEKVKEYPDVAVTANRIKRSEGFIFKFCYLAHKYLTLVFTGQTIKYGNYTCLPKSVVDEMVNEAATWSSFSGSLAKVAKNRKSIPSERGTRYFGPSKMSFLNLLKHSLSIIAVFKTTLLIRSILFLIAYLFLMIGKISMITLIPVIGVIIMMISVMILSKRENISEFNNSLDNIEKIDTLK
ncbi:glycosyltransferase involved in cell wall biosynthesis [Candidatus Pelagibacter ubique]|uniref:Glycosyltransferase involved in cell wall biosynthesis n=1 Tax=Pelagibacter ubique TaxID=198252 RepID=A0ABX1T0M0_PELUQ|nr:glycosyltransferase [Candidatus Pelagibacter ubique]NMN66984.1 glycosyltransferase involved in cell wall biosynthesis [Candidatus Pelagibacter ubique]